MSPKLYNSLTRRVEPLETIEPGKVRMYCCGVTVYDNCHLGHARSYIAWDVVRRYLTWRGYEVRYVQNFTDIDDKILNRARKEGSSMEEVAERYTQTYFEDMKRLNVLEADEYPRATHTMDGIKRLIHELESKGYAYASGGDVYYKVRQFSEYGKLSGRKFDEMQAGASGRVESEDAEAQKKKDPFDFALWKGAKSGEPAWDSPWGSGRPGWHIECSAMVRQSFGDRIDIHGGGSDLIFPHHENEIAQSEAVTGQPLATYWLHNGMVKVNGEKMSKSLGNFITIRELLDKPTDPMVVRLFVLTAHYRKPIDFTDDAIASAQNGWNTINEGFLFGHEYGSQFGWKLALEDKEAVQQFQSAMDDDFNTPNALAVVFELAKELRRDRNILIHGGKIETPGEVIQQKWHTLVSLLHVLGLTNLVPASATLSADQSGLTDKDIEILIQQRLAARKAKNFAEGDRIRNELKDRGITLIDQKDGTTIWHRN
ncbi:MULTISPECIES: cysteine--tRNA ligase [Kamptonema]|uniref:cysteine--tRNA ligase n=1 Tax=Kamptonema TaxID=1501433 RepID=UPI0001DACA81|nr:MULTISPECIES: cysteine--tRNA ligase [Kamptonema]CBN54472.1 Cysteinyl-tRNA synthetase [Kamptonema sp. PCC 6506]